MSQDVPVPEHIAAWAHESGPGRVLDDAFVRFERGQALAGGTCRVGLSEEERRRVGRILPATWVTSGHPVMWRELRASLMANGTTLEAVVAHRCGAWRNRLQDKRDERQESDRDHRKAVHILGGVLQSRTSTTELPTAAIEVLGRGLFGRRTTTFDAERILSALDGLPPAGDTVGLAVLAAQVFGDAHALDQVSALGRAVARFVRTETLICSGQSTLDASVGFTPRAWRSAWAGVGVVCDHVSSTVLVLNLPLVGEAPAVAIANAAAGEPVWLTLRSMAGEMSVPSDVTTVFVCENPSIVEAAADALGAASQPLICTYGRPSGAALQLLEAVSSPTVIRVQADADATGRAIVSALVARHTLATAWRMPDLGVVYEEELVGELLVDLQITHPSTPRLGPARGL